MAEEVRNLQESFPIRWVKRNTGAALQTSKPQAQKGVGVQAWTLRVTAFFHPLPSDREGGLPYASPSPSGLSIVPIPFGLTRVVSSRALFPNHLLPLPEDHNYRAKLFPR